ncbi:MAG: ATP-binding protein [Bacteroidota bacterium]
MLSANFSFAQSGLQHWTTQDGLSSNWVTQIVQDDEGYIWIATQYGLNRFDGYEFTSYYHEPDNINSLSANWTRSIQKDEKATFWLGIYYGGINAFHAAQDSIVKFPIYTADSSLVTSVFQVLRTANDLIWVATIEGLYVKRDKQDFYQKILNRRSKSLQQENDRQVFCLTETDIQIFDVTNLQKQEVTSFPKNAIKQIFIDREGVLWAFGSNKLIRLTKGEDNWKKDSFYLNNSPTQYRYADPPMYEDRQNQIWIGGQNGISVVSPDRKMISTIQLSNFFERDDFQGEVLAFFEDQDRNFWIGSTEGIYMKPHYTKRFEMPMDMSSINQYQEPRKFVQTDSLFWLANGSKLLVFNLNQPEYPPKTIIDDSILKLLKAADGMIYASGRGLYRIDANTLKAELLLDQITNLRSLAQDRNQRIWSANFTNLVGYDPRNENYQFFNKTDYPILKSLPSEELLIDRNGDLWGASLSNGIYFLEQAHQIDFQQSEGLHFLNFTHDFNNSNSLSNKLSIALLESRAGLIWVATESGLNRIDPIDFSIKRYLRKDGLLDEKIMGLLEDDFGYIWGSTVAHGLFRFDVDKETFEFFDRRDGLISDNFLLNATYKNEEGWLFFGSENGIQVIDPRRIDSMRKADVAYYFTHLELHQSTDSIQNRIINLQTTTSIEIPHYQRSFSIHFTTLNYFQPNKTQYLYQLEGLHNTWQSNGNKRSVNFTGLPPAKYLLKVKAVNPNLNFGQAFIELDLIVQPPWWQQKWALAWYAILILSVIYLIYRFQIKQRLKQAETQRLQELDRFKTRFFTNITHEFRTPLTVIAGMADQVQKNPVEWSEEGTDTIKRNSQQLLNLVNQMLELSKLESGSLAVNLVQQDIVAYLKYLTESFHSLANTKNIEVHFEANVDELWMDMDVEKLEHIFTNLMGNALKFTTPNGQIFVRIEHLAQQKYCQIRVADTGIGIAAAHLPHIFDRFYQAVHANDSTEGTGIGLALTKELVQVLGGTIAATSELGKGTSFVVQLPIKQTAQRLEGLPLIQQQRSKLEGFASDRLNPSPELTSNKEIALLIEDNADVLRYLQICLKDQYKLAIARDGAAGIETALALVPDIIISDVMMPKKDGFEVCATLKQDARSSHIPIILLTAKADDASRYAGLKTGADAYLIKPFDRKELEIRLQQLIELRKRLKAKYGTAELEEIDVQKEQDPELLFLKKLEHIILERLSDEHFRVEPDLCQAMLMSRPQLYRKLKALKDLSPSELIRSIRLREARRLLQTGKWSVGDVVEKVGFKDHSYFTKVYTATFGEMPSEVKR